MHVYGGPLGSVGVSSPDWFDFEGQISSTGRRDGPDFGYFHGDDRWGGPDGGLEPHDEIPEQQAHS